VSGAPIAAGVVKDVLVERAIRTIVRNTPHIADMPGAVSGLARAAARTIVEVERGGGTRESLAAVLENIGRPDRGAAVLVDTWAELERLRGSRTRSAADEQRSAIELLLERGDTLFGEQSFIVLEDLPLSGPLDRALVSALLSCVRCPVVATSEYAPQLESVPSTKAYHLLRSMAQWDERICNRDTDPLGGAGLRIFAPAPNQHDVVPPSLRIVRLQAAGEAGEVRLAARVIKRHMRIATADHPIRACDILIVARGARYRELICEIFPEHGIGADASLRCPAATTAIGSVLLRLLRLAGDASGGTRDDALSLLRMPHLDLGARAADRLARCVITHGYLGLDGWDARVFRAIGTRATNRVRRLRRAVATARQALSAANSNQEMARTVRRLAKELRLVGNAYFARERVVKGGLGDVLERQLADRSVREDNQSWELIEAVLDDTMPPLLHADASTLRDGKSSFAENWLSLFARALDAETIQQNTRAGDLVRVAGTSNGDGLPAKITIVLGLQQQQFPRQPRQNPFLSDSVCEQLRKRGIEMRTSEDTTDSERESFARAIASADENLYLSYPATDADGKPAVASFFMDDLQRAVGTEHQFGIERLGIADVVPLPEDATSRSELLAAVAHGVWQRLPATSESASDRAASFAAWNDLLASATLVVPITGARTRQPRQSFNREAMKQAPHSTLELSASQLKLIQHCTFQHFVERVLRPASLVTPEYDSLTKGTLVHEAMVQWVRLDGWRRGDAALTELDDWFELRARKLPPAAREGPLARYMIDTDRERLNAFVREELSTITGAEAAKPAYNELAFGERIATRGTHDAASTGATFDMNVDTSLGARVVKFNGSIDRVDTYEGDGVTYGIVLDYKTGESSDFHAKSMLRGTDLQVRLYLLALERLWNIKAVGALYVGFGDGIRRGAISEAAAARIGDFDPKCVTVMTADEWDNFAHAETERLIQPLIERLVTFDIIARPHKGDCGFCALGQVCRYSAQEAAVLNA
jgi:ATP-dependent helicase/DNAse subunit B